MHKVILWIAASFLAIGVLATTPNPQTSGYGEARQLTTTDERITWDSNEWVYSVSIYNGSTETVYALVNCSLADFGTAKAATKTVAIPASSSYTFTSQRGDRRITSICFDASGDTGAANVFFAAY